jgi:hypothetical protein
MVGRAGRCTTRGLWCVEVGRCGPVDVEVHGSVAAVLGYGGHVCPDVEAAVSTAAADTGWLCPAHGRHPDGRAGVEHVVHKDLERTHIVQCGRKHVHRPADNAVEDRIAPVGGK